MKLSKRKLFRVIWFSVVALFLIWNWSTFQARNLPEGTLTSNEAVNVIENDDQIIFKPKADAKTTEIIFFPGGMADPEAYSPLGRKMAENGFTFHIIKMSFRLPQRDYQKILKMFDLKSGHYIIGGHSQGAKMAAQFVYENPETMKGLFMLGTSHPRDISLSNVSIPMLKLYAENDGLASVPEVMENKGKLPGNTELILIEGGNHSQFGYLGKLLGDDDADISLEAQQAFINKHLLNFLNRVNY